jgi:hypothetical protein
MLSRTFRSIATGAAALALALPGTALAQDDLRSADAIDSDLRSAAAMQRDDGGGFDWDDAAVGGVAILGAVLALGGGTALVVSHRRDDGESVVPR